MWQNDTWKMPLAKCPRILQMSPVAVQHGVRGIERYRLENFWCLNLYLGTGELRIAGKTYPIRPGHASITCPDMDMEYEFEGQATLTWAHFLPDKTASSANIPVMQDLGADFDAIRLRLQDACYTYRNEPERAVARLWDILWTIATRANPTKRSPPQSLLGRAFELIERRIGQDIAIVKLASELDISQTHLNRLFFKVVRMTVSEFIRHRRMEQAEHLLRHTTLPVKTIAATVGISDPHHFNKLVKRYLGQAPQRVRHSQSKLESKRKRA